MSTSLNKQISIVTACRNRSSNLAKVVQSWIDLDPYEIIICDWGSTVPLATEPIFKDLIANHKIKVIRVEGVDRWILTWAFNEALALVASKFTVKVDCDHQLSKNFIENNDFQEASFSRGSWRGSSEEQAYINGAFISCSNLLRSVGYYDERITTYGWDDSDLYSRLFDVCRSSSLLSKGSIYHIEQDELSRTSEQFITKEARLSEHLKINCSSFLITRNRLLCGMLWPWNWQLFQERLSIREKFNVPRGEEEALLEYATIRAFEFHYYWSNPTATVNEVVDGYSQAVFDGTPSNSSRPIRLSIADVINRYSSACRSSDESAKTLIRGALLAATHGLRFERLTKALDKVEDICQSVNNHISSTLNTQSSSSARSTGLITKKKRIYVDVQHGLGNRLRAYGSAASIAEETDRELVLIWQPDEHCNARISDLFDYCGPLEESSFIHDAARMGMNIYNYMNTESGSVKDEEVFLSEESDCYLRSAYVFKSSKSTWEKENYHIQLLQPISFVKELVSQVRNPNLVAAHIRMEGGKEFEHLPYESPDNWNTSDHQKICEWRAKSHYSRFLRRLINLACEGKADTIFVASDSLEASRMLLDVLGERAVGLSRNMNDRSVEQLQYALADTILLSRTNLLLGSSWSSFTELALRIARNSIAVEMSGIDF